MVGLCDNNRMWQKMNREEGKFLIEEKVNDFYKNEKELLTKAFQETEVRSRFIDPFFEALGWDFSQTNLKKQFWDVQREFSQKDNSSTKKPDYAFRIKDGNKYREKFKKFFTEAKTIDSITGFFDFLSIIEDFIYIYAHSKIIKEAEKFIKTAFEKEKLEKMLISISLKKI